MKEKVNEARAKHGATTKPPVLGWRPILSRFYPVHDRILKYEKTEGCEQSTIFYSLPLSPIAERGTPFLLISSNSLTEPVPPRQDTLVFTYTVQTFRDTFAYPHPSNSIENATP